MRQRVSHMRSWLQEMEALLGGAGALAPQARLMQRQRDAVKLQLRTMLDTVAAFHTHVLVRASPLGAVSDDRSGNWHLTDSTANALQFIHKFTSKRGCRDRADNLKGRRRYAMLWLC